MTVNDEGRQQRQPAQPEKSRQKPTPRPRWWKQLNWKQLTICGAAATVPLAVVWLLHALNVWLWLNLLLTVIIIAAVTFLYYVLGSEMDNLERKLRSRDSDLEALQRDHQQTVAQRDDLRRQLPSMPPPRAPFQQASAEHLRVADANANPIPAGWSNSSQRDQPVIPPPAPATPAPSRKQRRPSAWDNI